MDLELTDEELDAFFELEDAATLHPLAIHQASPALQAFSRETHRWLVLRAANRVGKSYQGAEIVARDVVETPGRRWRCIGPTITNTHRVQGDYLAQFLAPHLDRRSYFIPGRGWNTDMILLNNGSWIELKSFRDDPQTHAGADLDGVWMDEVPVPAIWRESLLRISSRRGRILLTVTPVDRPTDWLVEELEGKEESEDRRSARLQEQQVWDKRRAFIQIGRWRQYVVEYSHEHCPWYTRDQVAEHLDVLSAAPWQFLQRAKGAWEGLTEDRKLTGFDSSNVKKHGPVGRAKLGAGLDHGKDVGHEVAVFGAWQGYERNEYGRKRRCFRFFILNECANSETFDPMACGLDLKKAMAELEWEAHELDLMVGDNNFRLNEEVEEGLANAYQLKRWPCPIETPDKTDGSVGFGVAVLNWMCARGEIIVHPRCRRLIKAMKDWRGGDKGTDFDLKHWIDALRYLVLKVVGDTETYARLRFLP